MKMIMLLSSQIITPVLFFCPMETPYEKENVTVSYSNTMTSCCHHYVTSSKFLSQSCQRHFSLKSLFHFFIFNRFGSNVKFEISFKTNAKNALFSLRNPKRNSFASFPHLFAPKRDDRLFLVLCHAPSRIGLTRESLFEILARSETRFLDPNFRETRESKLVATLASRESHRQKFHSENCEKRVLLQNFVAKIAS